MKALKEQIERLGRLQKRSNFLHVQKNCKKWVSKSLILQVADNDSGETRFGLTVTKKVNKRAVVRNRIRRRLRALAFDVLPGHAAEGKDYVLIGRAETETNTYEDMAKDLKWCLKRLECRKDTP
ncbi:MAG: ribonuclease P protein component [Rhodospirillales bacterium]|nr:ribonuclease P protein component [Rhodospirillales bacterium]